MMKAFQRWSMLALTAIASTSLFGSDPQPTRSLFEDRWPGWYYSRVEASYSVELRGQLSQVKRTLSPNIEIFSESDRVRPFQIASEGIRPTHASVSITYPASVGKQHGVANVTLYWPLPSPDPVSGQRQHTEVRQRRLSADDIRHFLRRSGRFRVDDDFDYYTDMKGRSRESAATIERKISASIRIVRKFDPSYQEVAQVKYHDESVLREIIDKAWKHSTDVPQNANDASKLPVTQINWEDVFADINR